jgi:hypothetical protein
VLGIGEVWYDCKQNRHSEVDDGEEPMSDATTANEISHDELIERIAAQAIDASIFTAYINNRQAQQRAVKGQYPHIVGVGKTSPRVDMVGMVETAKSLHDLDAAARRWRPLDRLQAAIYLYVPKGHCADARTLCLRETIRVSDFRHYWFDEDGLHIERCFA